MTAARPKVEIVPLDQLAPDPGNARVHGRDNLAAIKAGQRPPGARHPSASERARAAATLSTPSRRGPLLPLPLVAGGQ